MSINVPISSLPIAIGLDGSEYVALDQAGTTKRALVSLINSTNPANLPIGGLTGQALVKSSNLNYQTAWATISGAGTVQEVDTGTGLTGGPITLTGTISLASIANGTILANVSGGSAAPSPNTPSAVLDVIGSTRGNLLYRGAGGWSALAPGSAGQILTTGGAGADPAWSPVGAGSVQSVALALPPIFTVTGSPVTTTGTLTGSLNTQSANVIFGGPSSGIAATPTFRFLVGADLPVPTTSALGGVQAINAVSHQWINSINGSGVPQLSQPAFTDISGTVAAAQLPNPSASTLGGIQSLAAVASRWINQISTTGIPSASQPAFTDISGSASLSQLPSISNSSVLGNNSGSTAVPSALSASQVLDMVGSTQGQVLYRGASGWSALGVGTSGQVLTTNGAAANPSWNTVSGTGTVTSLATNNGITGGTITTTGTIGLDAIANGTLLANTSGILQHPTATTPSAVLDVIGSSIGSVLYRAAGGTGWQALAAGTNGQVLTMGASTPAWGNAGSVTTVSTSGIVTGGPITSSGTIGINATIVPQGRLTLASGVPVMVSTVAGATTVYYTPASGNIVPIYDGTNMIPTAISEISQLTTDATKSPAAATTNSNYDIFGWNDGGTIRATRGPAWSSNTSRGTGVGTSELQLVNGIYLNKNSITNGPAANRGTYLGTIRTNGSSQVDYIVGGSGSGGVAASLGVWNLYNRNLANGQSIDSGAGYAYLSGTIRQARGSSGNQVSLVVGLAVDTITVTYQTRIDTAATSGAFGAIGIGEDTTSVYTSPRAFSRTVANVAIFDTPYTSLIKVPLLGYHTYSGNENSDGNSNTFDSDSIATLTIQVRN